jgi:2-methylisocitrate lyase-like PEP mutase family enzyme
LARLQSLGYRIVIIPSDLQRAAIRAMEDVLKVIGRDGNSTALADRMASFKEREAILETDSYLERGRHYDRGTAT